MTKKILSSPLILLLFLLMSCQAATPPKQLFGKWECIQTRTPILEGTDFQLDSLLKEKTFVGLRRIAFSPDGQYQVDEGCYTFDMFFRATEKRVFSFHRNTKPVEETEHQIIHLSDKYLVLTQVGQNATTFVYQKVKSDD